ncbi:hypothetical protein CEE69_18295 [Rhodopirellula bahusiensis]|uniref:Uncharacterized protein n=1 Tax=Rhodopirellula bahusiensis TaxID=2014065 RepID=A0A2G1W4A8_9BACT|nr:hypothetical protein CEE69_18295 [Rhodopirellula bahusiensis]
MQVSWECPGHKGGSGDRRCLHVVFQFTSLRHFFCSISRVVHAQESFRRSSRRMMPLSTLASCSKIEEGGRKSVSYESIKWTLNDHPSYKIRCRGKLVQGSTHRL